MLSVFFGKNLSLFMRTILHTRKIQSYHIIIIQFSTTCRVSSKESYVVYLASSQVPPWWFPEWLTEWCGQFCSLSFFVPSSEVYSLDNFGMLPSFSGTCLWKLFDQIRPSAIEKKEELDMDIPGLMCWRCYGMDIVNLLKGLDRIPPFQRWHFNLLSDEYSNHFKRTYNCIQAEP